MCAAFLLSNVSYAQTDEPASAPKTTKATKAKKEKKKTSKSSKSAKAKQVKGVQFDRGSEEGPAERDSRLRRECKGRPNAGACAGLAS